MLLVIAVLIFSVILHEVAHGWVALMFGDDTAKRAGRLTLNPLPHIDPFGSVIFPGLCFLLGGLIFGWAKPVPVDFNKIHPNRFGTICVSLAGVVTNFVLAIGVGIFLRFFASSLSLIVIQVLLFVIRLNLVLGVFNLLPIPPLDGWRIWGIWLPDHIREQVERYALFFIFALFVLLPILPVWPIVNFLLSLILGTH